jgi:pimeloyl-ACP methyl ester carboxylesterase
MLPPLPRFLSQLYPFKNDPVDNYCELSSGYKLHFVDEGSGDPIVMLHGNPTWSFFYRNLILNLKSDYRLLALDNLGCGLSDKPAQAAYNLAEHIQNTIEWFESLNLKRFSLIIHDWGGPIGLGLANHFSDRLDKLIILNTAGFLTKQIPSRIAFLKTPKLGEYAIRKWNLFVRFANQMTTQKPMSLEVQMGYAYPYDTWENRIAIARFVQDIPLTPNHISYQTLQTIEKNLVKLRSKPVLICWGGKDFCFDRHFYDKWLKILPEAQHHYFPEAGHYLLEDALEPITQLIHNFL